MKLPLWRVAEFLSASGEFDPEAVAEGYSIDSRGVQRGELFFAVKGEHLDGHDYVEKALAAGAVGAVVATSQAGRFSSRSRLIFVADTLVALQTLGSVVRKVWGKAVVAVTGSAGKTTTKEAIAQVLAARFHVFKSQGNLNNHFGLPLQLLKLDHDHEKAVVEMGMNHAGEIAALCKIAVPEWGVVTNVNPVHIEHFADGIAGVARAKYELVAALPSGGRAFLNADDPYVSQFGRDFKGKAVTFGTHPSADVRAEEIIDLGAAGSEFTLVAGGVRERGALHLMGRHNVHNALAAAAVGLEAGLAPSDCMRALAQLAPSDKRGQVKELGGAIIINDSYNSNPAALRSMTDALMGIEAKRHIVVAGEMLELGPAAVELHRQCGEYMAGRGISYLIGVRGNAVALVEGARSRGTTAEFVETPEMAAAQLKQMLQPGDAVLFKASRGVRLERAIDELERALAGNEEGVLPSSSGHD